MKVYDMRVPSFMIRTLSVFALLPLLLSACTESPTSTSQTDLGETTLDDFLKNAAYVWFQTGYDAYPENSQAATFNQYVDQIESAMATGGDYEVVMVVKPNCGCQDTQREMPRVVKTLDAAGMPRSDMHIFVTDARLAGIDSVKSLYNIIEAPTFLVLKDGQELGRIVEEPGELSTIEKDLATIFTNS